MFSSYICFNTFIYLGSTIRTDLCLPSNPAVLPSMTATQTQTTSTQTLSTIDGDIRNIELIDQLTKDSDLVLHMAAALGVNTILESPLESMSTIRCASYHENHLIPKLLTF